MKKLLYIILVILFIALMVFTVIYRIAEIKIIFRELNW